MRKTDQEFMDALAGAILDADFASAFHTIQSRYNALDDDTRLPPWRKLANGHRR